MAPVRSWSSSWIVRSLSVNAGGSLLDWLTVLSLVHAAHAPTAVGTLAGLVLGCAFSFWMNKKFAFKSQGPAGPQVLKYVAGMAVLMAVHATVVGMLVDSGRVPLVFAKLAADGAIMASGQLLLLRLVVFKHAVVAPVAVPVAAPAPVLAAAPAVRS